MPLEFHSLSHSRIAFGFFNIETDLLLLEKYFFFAHYFCSMVSEMSAMQNHRSNEISLVGYFIDRPGDIGNLMGAIQGIDLRGFIGQVYKLFPFPQSREEFKQKTYGPANRSVVKELISRWARSTRIPVEVETDSQRVRIAEFLFSKTAFQELVAYVWQGGMPGWQDNIRPDYVIAMKDAISSSTSPIFEGCEL